MDILPFADQYDLVAPLYDMTAADLRRRDEERGSPPRWVALRGGRAVGAVTAMVRPDDRLFLSFAGDDPAAYGPLADAVAGSTGRPLHAMVDAGEAATVAALEAAGFTVENASEAFRVRFDVLLAWLERAWVPSGYSIHPADQVDEERLFELDNELRRDVPGTDGWRGDREWFREELAEAPPFDPSAYLVALHDATGAYVGLVRIWRNRRGPRLGLIGVVRSHRGTLVAAALLKQAVAAAATWGSEVLETETSISNAAIHPRLLRLGAAPTARFLQLTRP